MELRLGQPAAENPEVRQGVVATHRGSRALPKVKKAVEKIVFARESKGAYGTGRKGGLTFRCATRQNSHANTYHDEASKKGGKKFALLKEH